VTRPLVDVRGLTIRFGDLRAVDAADLMVPDGGVTVLVGPSGCGKTSLLRAVAGFEVPAEGSVHLAGRCVAGSDETGRRCWQPPERRQVGMVFQEGVLFPHLDVAANVAYGLSGSAAARRRRVREMLELVGMAGLGGRYPDQLSGGQQQRVALARALAPSPRLVLLDEPFANLDAALRERLREEVRQILLAAGATALLVTHDQAEALSMADRLAVMEGGRVLQSGPPSEVYRRPASAVVARLLGDGQLVPCDVAAGRLQTPFGTAVVAAADGAGLLLMHPEDLEVRPLAAAGGCTGRVVRRRYFGHDLVDEVALDGVAGRAAGSVLVRLLAPSPYPVGSRVRVVPRPEELWLFPVAAGGAVAARLEPFGEPA